MRKLTRRLMNRLKNNAGETIGETLIALLISALALTMLAGAIMASFNMIRNSRNRLDTYYKQAEGVAWFSESIKKNGEESETINTGATVINGKITIGGESVDVTIATNNAFSKTPVVAYKKK